MVSEVRPTGGGKNILQFTFLLDFLSSFPSFWSPMSSPSSPDALYPGPNSRPHSPSNYPITRTVAIIKTHALAHRFHIEPRIQEASFEIVKERQMEFDTETDPDTLYELFGEDATSFSEGPVWVYVLERRRAVEVWNTLMGDCDPEVARRDAPNSLRALYGKSLQQNGLMGSSDVQIAEIQIASLFASSPPFPTSDLPDADDRYGSMRSVSSSVLAALQQHTATSDEGYAASSATNPSTVGGTKLTPNGKSAFRARPIPATNANPDIVPRMTRSAALRAGIVVEKTESGPRGPLSKEQLAKTFQNVPGHKRSESISVASTAAPAIAPRMTRAASLRLGIKPETPRRRSLSTDEAVKSTFDGVPGHKRRESIAVASVKAPTLAPRLNKSAALRAQKEPGPPSSFMFRGATAPKLPGLARSSSQGTLGPSRPTPAPVAPPRPASQASQAAAPSRYAIKRSSSVSGARPSLAPRTTSTSNSTSDARATEERAAAKARPRPSSVASISNPTIPPRTNRSAALRAAKQEAEQAAAAAAAARKNPRAKLPPSSFRQIAT
ncbi:hypothetical protein D9615_002854 [Tricholomella constricta]|uniref:Nucleoside diphosphate kinase n=1 Tax=Tricholomella constricta TaxID=117010 RepID=A0A8H5M6G1_9AGAR|nr:hypothetical protein D9615_002854 [Tricholomella constricta]